MKHQPWIKYRDMPVEFASHFLDSGSFSLRVEAHRYAKKHKVSPWFYYTTDAFKDYLDSYCKFIKKYKAAIDYYSVMDVIGDPDRTWAMQRCMEQIYGLKPIPCVHYRTDLKWLKHYIDHGHDYISIGGLVGQHNQEVCRDWIDRVFTMIADKDGKPTVKLHGFGVTSWALMVRYPWYSVDSATWVKRGQFGGIFVPVHRKKRFDFMIQPRIVTTAMESPDRKRPGKHYFTQTDIERKVVDEWLDRIGIPLGRMNEAGEILEVGVVNDHSSRMNANMIFFEQLAFHLPDWPWPFQHRIRKGFGIVL